MATTEIKRAMGYFRNLTTNALSGQGEDVLHSVDEIR